MISRQDWYYINNTILGMFSTPDDIAMRKNVFVL